MLVEFKDYIKQFNIDEHFSIGKIDSSKDKSIGVYGDSNPLRVEAIGRESTYDIANIRILVHWTKNLKDTEEAAKELFSNLRYKNNFDMNGIYVNILDISTGEPIFIGTDENGVYEYVITLRLYYRR